MNIALNGFGRIGRTLLRCLLDAPTPLVPTVINCGPSDPERLAHLFVYDTTMGRYHQPVSYQDGCLHIGEHRILLIQELTPAACNWKKHAIDWVIEASGQFTSRDKAQQHRVAGAKRVLITAPGTDVDRTIIYGLNHDQFNPASDKIISLGSCTTNCLAPIVQVLQEACGIRSGMVTSIHAYTSDQRLLDNDHKDLRRARAAAQNIIPTKTGAGKAITQLFPELEGRLHAVAMRVPTPNVSLIDFSFIIKRPITKEVLNKAFIISSDNALSDILACESAPLVSSDFCKNRASAIIDLQLTAVTGNLAKICAWYDNEFAYCCRVVDFLLHKITIT